ncbi:MAG: 2-oxo-4-hydroxy-4-carboxy-5-ureidoimidazoline decarboxylase [Cyanobacteria bacterium P01_D01_bin.123]
MTYSLAAINGMDRDRFVAVLGGIFENTPTIAAAVWHRRPFVSVAALHEAMINEMQSLESDRQLTLIRAHPDLGSKAQMAPASMREQAAVGLDRLSPSEFETFQQLNRAYTSKFGFPFIIAVKHHTKASILSAFTRRLQHAIEVEKREALKEISDIARLRLDEIVTC